MPEESDSEKLPGIEPSAFWQALASRAAGVSVVTAMGTSGPAGFMALSVTHLTPRPPTVMVSIGNATGALSSILEARHFAVNFLASGQELLADMFAGRTPRKGSDRFDAEAWSAGKTRAPVLRGTCGHLDCVLVEIIERYETFIALGRIIDFGHNYTCAPLIHYRGSYLRVENSGAGRMA